MWFFFPLIGTLELFPLFSLARIEHKVVEVAIRSSFVGCLLFFRLVLVRVSVWLFSLDHPSEFSFVEHLLFRFLHGLRE